MKILLVSNMYPSADYPFFGTFVQSAENILINNGFNVDRVVIDIKVDTVLKKALLYLFFYINIISKIVKNDYDTVYIHYISHTALPVFFMKIFKRKIKIVSHVHGGDVKKLNGSNSVLFLIKKIISSIALRYSSLLVFPSISYKDFVVDYYSLSISDILIFPSGGVDHDIFNVLESNPRRNVIGFAGRFIKSKNVDLLIESMRFLADDWKLELVGYGDQKSYLHDLVKKHGLSNRVYFFKPKSHPELANWYRTIDILVYPSETESLGLVPLEAMSCGSLTLLSKIPAFIEFSKLGINTFYLNEITPEFIARSINLVNNITTIERNEMLLNNISLVNKHYGKVSVTEGFINAFRKL